MFNKICLWILIVGLGCICISSCDSTAESDGHNDISEEYSGSDIDKFPLCTPTKPSGACDVSTAEGCRDETEICRCEPLCGNYEPQPEETHRWRCLPAPPPNPEACPDSSRDAFGACSPNGLSCIWYGDCWAKTWGNCVEGKWQIDGSIK